MFCDIGQSARATQKIYNSIWDTQTGGHKRCPKVLGKKLLRTFPIKIICWHFDDDSPKPYLSFIPTNTREKSCSRSFDAPTPSRSVVCVCVCGRIYSIYKMVMVILQSINLVNRLATIVQNWSPIHTAINRTKSIYFKIQNTKYIRFAWVYCFVFICYSTWFGSHICYRILVVFLCRREVMLPLPSRKTTTSWPTPSTTTTDIIDWMVKLVISTKLSRIKSKVATRQQEAGTTLDQRTS